MNANRERKKALGLFLACGGTRPCERCKEASRQAHEDRLAVIDAAKKKPCIDCGHSFPHYVMQFDHCRGEKKFNIRTMAQRCTMKQLLEEMAKCDVVCANCHCVRTFNRTNSES